MSDMTKKPKWQEPIGTVSMVNNDSPDNLALSLCRFTNSGVREALAHHAMRELLRNGSVDSAVKDAMGIAAVYGHGRRHGFQD